MSNAVQTTQKRDIRALIQSERVREQIALALPKHLTPDRMMRVALTTINRTPKLLQCSPESLLSGLMLCSQVGLEPDGRNAHLIPYGDQVQVIFDYKGLIALARRNGVANIASDVVCEGDQFEWFRDADGLHFRHVVDWKKKRGEVYAAYCIWKDAEQFDGEVMTRDEIDAIRKRSRAGNNGPWVTDWNEMAKKTVVRRASKKWPLDPEAAAAFNGDDDILKDAPTTRPVFNGQPAAPALFTPAVPQLTEDTEDDVPYDTPPKTEAKAEAAPIEQPKTEAPGRNYLKAVNGLLKLSHTAEADLLQWLREVGKADETLTSLAQVWEMQPSAVQFAHDNWSEAERAIRAVKGGTK